MENLKLKEEGLYFIAEAMNKVREILEEEYKTSIDLKFGLDGNGEIHSMDYKSSKGEEGRITGEALNNLIAVGIQHARNKEYTPEEKEIVKTIENITHHLLKQAKEEHRKSIIMALSHVRNSALLEKLTTSETTKKAKEAISSQEIFNYLTF